MAKQVEQAFPGDTYISDLQVAAKSGKIWTKFLFSVVVLAAIADFYFMQDTLAVAAGWPAVKQITEVIDTFLGNQVSGDAANPLAIAGTLIVAASMVFTYLFIGRIAGKKYKEYRSFGERQNLAEMLIALAFEVIALIGFTVIRYDGEMLQLDPASPTFYEDYMAALVMTALMTLIMVVAAFLAIFHSYVTGDSVAAATLENARASLSEDRALYDREFAKHAINPSRNRKYERRELDIDNRAIASAFRLSSLASQLNGVLDPADAYEFRQIGRMAIDDYYNADGPRWQQAEPNAEESNAEDADE